MGRPKKPRTKEHYYKAAKAHGYRARSAYKLRQIASKYKLLEGVDKAVELCSSPGGWTQVLLELSHTIQVIAVDLTPMIPLEGAIFIQGDILDPDVIEQITHTAGGPVDLVLSDCSPKVSGNWDLDVARQLALAESTLEIGLKLLRGNGKVLAKVFQGRGFQAFLQTARNMYRSVRLVKPLASRSTSAEIYLLAMEPRKGADSQVSQV